MLRLLYFRTWLCGFFFFIAMPASFAAGTTEFHGAAPLRAAIAQSEGRGFEDNYIDKIFGGQPAKWEDHKWQVALVASRIRDNARGQFCGGALIKENWVLTAAHCVDNGTITADFEILSGTGNLNQGGIRGQVSRVFIHRDYTPEVLYPEFRPVINDIALVKLKNGAMGQPIDLIPEKDIEQFLRPGDELVVTGWGITESGEVSTLMQVNVPMVSRDTCNAPASYDGLIAKTMFCAGLEEGGKDSCAGDSGGPGVSKGKLVALVSWGRGCGKAFKFGVYTNIAIYKEWIANCISNEETCEEKTFLADLAGNPPAGRSEPLELIVKAYEIFPREIADEITGEIQKEAVEDLRTGRSMWTLYLADRFYKKVDRGAFSGLPVVRWNGFDHANGRPRFVFDPEVSQQFSYKTSRGNVITPGIMDTDGGTIPLALHVLPKFSAWGYAPAYLIHDWLFVRHKCQKQSRGDKVEFPESATILAEAIKTLMETGYVDYDKKAQKFPKAEDTLYLIYKAVSSSIAKKLWDDTTSVQCR